MKIRNKKLLTKSIAMAIFMSSTLYTMPITQASTALNNNFLPQKPNIINGQVEIKTPDNNTMNITQTGQNAVIKWNDFSIGANATVNFNEKDGKSFNTLNYVNGGNLSQIYGTINATNGNIYIVNPAGVQIGDSAQINVGSLYVSNKNLDESKLSEFNGSNFDYLIDINKTSNAELMSLGNINATNVTFDGNRIVLDVDRVNRNNGQNATINLKTTEENNVVLGTDSGTINKNIKIEGLSNTNATTNATYTWVKNLNQLQNMSSSGNYALRNNIDASATKDKGAAFTSIDNFTGKFDGLDYNIFGLHADKGLFASADGATIRNFSMISGEIGSSSNTKDNVGAVVGTANDSTIENILNTSKVTGASNVGGIVGSATDSTLSGLINTGAIKGTSNVGGLVGSLIGDKKQSSLAGESYNLGDIKGTANNIGGLVGSASHSTIGNETGFQIYNHLDVEGGYNVGGIVGNLENGSIVQNVYNDGNISTTGYTTETYKYHTSDTTTDNKDGKSDGFGEEKVRVANVGGIVGNSSGSTIKNVQNTGDVKSSKQESNDYYDAGNVGGIVGRAENTNITKAVNKESNIYGAHNVGGIAGYFGGSYNTGSDTQDYSIKESQNNGSDIMATGARNDKGFVKEQIRKDGTSGSDETFIVGNMGGIAGYMSGDNTHIIDSSNRGTIHSLYISNPNDIKDPSKAANTGGIVGKIDRGTTLKLEDLNKDNELAAVSGSYNTSEVSGYTGIGGVVGMMYNGEVTKSYNVGTVQSTRKSGNNTLEPINMGGVIGDTTELSKAEALIYDVYNAGQVGDETYKTYGRHVGGVVGRLSGDLIKAYNTGNIYNAFNVNGGVVGYWYKGDIKNVFNTGNITINANANGESNDNRITSPWETGGIVGAYYDGTYGGGAAGDKNHKLTNAYNLGSIRVVGNGSGKVTHDKIAGIIGGSANGGGGAQTIKNVYTVGEIYVDDGSKGSKKIHAITQGGGTVNIENAVYIEPEKDAYYTITGTNLDDATSIKYNANNWDSVWNKFMNNSKSNPNDKNEPAVWRIYDGTTPILNAFTPDAKDYFDKIDKTNISNIQYGTAYNPLLTIITGKGNEIEVNWSEANITGMAGLVVNGSALTINNVSSKDNVLYSGTIYTDKALTINSKADGGNISLGSAAKIYGSSIDINVTNGNFNSNGTIVATGANGNKGDNGNITIDANSINNYGVIKTTSNGEKIEVEGISNKMNTINYSEDDIKNPNKDLPTVGEKYGVTIKNTTISNGSKDVSDVTITGKDDVNIYYGNLEQGLIDVAGDVNLKGKNVYVDSDMVIDGNLNATADSTGEIVLDISNIGKVTNNSDIVNEMHAFLDSFTKGTGKSINFAGTDNAKITVDLWDYDNNKFDLNKYDLDSDNTLSSKLDNLNVTGINDKKGKDFVYIWVADGEQLKGIQDYANKNTNSNILSYNFALKNDINATDVSAYQAIGGDYSNSNGSNKAFTGNFDGRGNRIIGLNTSGTGIFGTISKNDKGENGKVSNLKVYSSNFQNGAIANVNNGTIDNVTGLGNTITGEGNVGGFVGTNNGTIENSSDRSTVISEDAAIAGGLVGTNTYKGTIENSITESAVTSEGASGASMGGIAGTNNGTIKNVDSLGVTSGLYIKTDGTTDGTIVSTSNNVGGIVGTNTGTINSAYNESIVTGQNNVGGIAGKNTNSINDISNAGSVTGDAESGKKSEYVGGLVGSNTGSITNGRNNGTITGQDYVGGMVGYNGKDSSLSNLVNDDAANITGEQYVGGIAGTNSGSISTTDTNLINRGSITGNKYVGGIAGENKGTIANVNNDIVLNATGSNAQYFGGVTGINTKDGTITNATNRGDINANGATYVGGIAGENNGKLENFNGNYGNVTGGDKVGGAVGKNTVAINNVELVSAGTVTSAGGAGGIFAENSGKITNSDLSNSGTVTGGGNDKDSGTGGLIGINSGDIEKTSLRNEVNGNVTGTNNVGGLIGINSGTITGGRDDANTYYKYQIYNNGTITATGNGSNIGGLIGYNKKDTTTGSLTAGYNTGVINASNSSNVGGIVGNNEGIVKEVFNTIAGNDSVTGNTNVGGLIGTNSGTLSNAYSTSSVEGNVVGNVVGNNNKNSTVINVYATNTSGNLIGTNNGTITKSYSFSSSDDGITGGITYLKTEASQKNKNNYTSFDEKNTWKFYDGNANPLLKVFLTKAEFVPAKDKDGNNVKPNFVYNGKQQGVLIHYDEKNKIVEVLDAKNTVIGTIKVANEDAAHSLEDYINTIGKDNQLINGVQFVDAGTYEMLFSQQINTDGEKGNPNNLGFDFVTSLDNTNPNNDPPTITNDKAKLTITGNYLDRIYGNTDIQNGGYGITIDGWVNGEEDSNLIVLDGNSITDEALTGNTTGKVTNNAGDYTWTGTIIGSGDGLKNYEFDTSVEGDSKVNKATIDIVAGDTTMNKGGNPAYSGSISGIVNGDSIDTVFGSNWHWGIEDSSLTDKVETHKGVITINIDGEYYYFADQQELSNALKNYNVNIEAGDLTVKDNGGSVPIEPIKPVVPGIWSHIYQDQWDRNRDFKERKAEFNFVDGAIPLDEAVEEA